MRPPEPGQARAGSLCRPRPWGGGREQDGIWLPPPRFPQALHHQSRGGLRGQGRRRGRGAQTQLGGGEAGLWSQGCFLRTLDSHIPGHSKDSFLLPPGPPQPGAGAVPGSELAAWGPLQGGTKVQTRGAAREACPRHRPGGPCDSHKQEISPLPVDGPLCMQTLDSGGPGSLDLSGCFLLAQPEEREADRNGPDLRERPEGV